MAAALPAGHLRDRIDEDLSALADRGTYGGGAEPAGQRPDVRRAAGLDQAEPAADAVVLIVQDSGPGIPPELVPHLFDRFMRGAGLGLFIVRHLVEANGGSVRYERAEPTAPGWSSHSSRRRSRPDRPGRDAGPFARPRPWPAPTGGSAASAGTTSRPSKSNSSAPAADRGPEHEADQRTDDEHRHLELDAAEQVDPDPVSEQRIAHPVVRALRGPDRPFHRLLGPRPRRPRPRSA